jgi:hypothetical protein
MAAFVNALLSAYWEHGGCDIDGGDFQDLAAEHGIIEQVPFDPDVHGEDDQWGSEPGDPWYQRSALLRSLDPGSETEGSR